MVLAVFGGLLGNHLADIPGAIVGGIVGWTFVGCTGMLAGNLTALGLIHVNKLIKDNENNKGKISNDLEQQALPNTSHPSNPTVVTVRVTDLTLKR